MSDAKVKQILELLSQTKVRLRQGRSSTWLPAPVDFSSLDSEYIGILYEGLLDFELRTGRQPSRRFQILPAWQQTASLGMDEAGEWAFWAPSGYYDASFEGHRLFTTIKR